MQTIRVVGAVIFDPQTDSYFIGQRARTKKHPLKWEFIGGKVEGNENLLETTEREFLEETGLNIKANKLLHSTTFNYGGEIGSVEINFVECENFLEKPKFNPDIYEICIWVPKEKMLELDWIEADKDFVKSLILH